MIKWLKSLFCRKKCVQKRVLEKVNIVKPIKKKHYSKAKKQEKKKCQK